MASRQTPSSKPPGAGYPAARTARPRWRRIALLLLGGLVVSGLLIVGCGVAYVSRLDGQLHRTDAFAGVVHQPRTSVAGTQNILILGSDSRAGSASTPSTTTSNNERSDTIMVLHVSADHRKAYLISIPRDTYVSIPALHGRGGVKSKINAAFAWGGIPLTVMTVENFTGVRIDHVVKIDFNGFKEMTDALGGVDVKVAQTVTDPRSHRTFKAGVDHLNGTAALDYVRQRYGLPDSDFDRIHRQQIFLRALLQKATDSGTLTNPVKLKNFLDAATHSLTVDKSFSLTDMALEFRTLRTSDLSFVTSPHAGSQMIDGQSVVISDREKALALWSAVEKDQVATWLAANGATNVTGGR